MPRHEQRRDPEIPPTPVAGVYDTRGVEHALGLAKNGLAAARSKGTSWVLEPAGMLNAGHVWLEADVRKMAARRSARQRPESTKS